jgi:hypothetical protein
MKELIENNGWFHFRTGCPCVGSPKWYNNQDHPDYRIVLKKGKGSIRREKREVFRTADLDKFKNKLIEYGLITEN